MPSPSNLLDMSGKVVIITGSTRGIGRATAELVAAHGGRVVISSRKPEACTEAAEDFVRKGLEAIAVPCHVGDDAQRQDLIAKTLEAYGGLDGFVANAAVNPIFSSLSDYSQSAWSKVLEVDLTSAWRFSQLALPHIAAQGGGAMILVSSTASIKTTPTGAYGVAKAGLEHLGRMLAAEWGPRGVRVNSVVPGPTETDMIREAVKEPGVLEQTVECIPLKRINAAKDVGAAILFLLSEAGRQITGQSLFVDGGWCL